MFRLYIILFLVVAVVVVAAYCKLYSLIKSPFPSLIKNSPPRWWRYLLVDLCYDTSTKWPVTEHAHTHTYTNSYPHKRTHLFTNTQYEYNTFSYLRVFKSSADCPNAVVMTVAEDPRRPNDRRRRWFVVGP